MGTEAPPTPLQGGGLRKANIWSLISFSWPYPLIRKGWITTFDEPDARFLITPGDDAPNLARSFETTYQQFKASAVPNLKLGVWACLSAYC